MKFFNKAGLLAVLFLIPLMFISCGESIDEEAVSKEMTAAENDLQMTVNRIETEIDNLEAKADTVEADASAEIDVKIQQLESLKQKANDKLEELSNVAAADWKNFKAELSSFKNDLESDFNDVVAEGKKLESEMESEM